MAHSPIDHFAATAAVITSQLGELRDEVMSRTTPCSDWAVQDLVEHLVDNSYFFAGAAGVSGSRSEAITPTNAVSAYQQAVDAVMTAYGAPGTLDRDLATPFGTFPGGIVLSVAFADQLTHAWDLGRAFGEAPVVDEDLVRAAMTAWEAFIQQDLRDGSMFNQPTEPGPDPSPLDRLAAFTGRSVM